MEVVNGAVGGSGWREDEGHRAYGAQSMGSEDHIRGPYVMPGRRTASCAGDEETVQAAISASSRFVVDSHQGLSLEGSCRRKHWRTLWGASQPNNLVSSVCGSRRLECQYVTRP